LSTKDFSIFEHVF